MQVWHRLMLLAPLLLTGCSGEPDTGPGEVRWDREICERCAMAVSDHNFSAQLRGGPAGKNTRLYKFDDVGCAVIWLDQQAWKDDPRTEFWVTDHRDGEWIDARTAKYVTGKITPMAYGLGAQNDDEEGLLDFTAARNHIYVVEERQNIHGGSQLHPQPGH